jgi:hypothetical protein
MPADDVLNSVVNTVVGPAATATSLGLPAAGSVPVNLNLLGAQFLNFMIGDLYDSTVSNYNVSVGVLQTTPGCSFDDLNERNCLHVVNTCSRSSLPCYITGAAGKH